MLRQMLASMCLVFICAGCAAHKDYLTFHRSVGGNAYRQTFTNAYMLREPAGDYHFILVADGVQNPPDLKPGAPLEPAKIAPLRQLVHVHVFWRPRKGSKPDNPSSTNAAIDWYFISHAGLSDESVVHYQGSGFVTLNVSTRSASVHVRSAGMEAGVANGDLHDALGSGNIHGDFLALLDPGEVRDLLAEIKSLND
ncbi:MAG TPA: hypothetical protein VGG19_02100 [Tepidisphaeraceae bacterium]|jgi:hypothetical protein